MTLNDETALERMNEATAQLPEYPEGEHEGRGIIICGGGAKYFTCAWVCINMLRRLGCTLPIELWYLGEGELRQELREFVKPLDVTCIDGYVVRERHPARILNGWEIKPFAILHSRFREVIALDADNVPVRDPTYMFNTDGYRQHGAIFWPDYGRLGGSRSIWRLTGVRYVDEPEVESGQIVVDKQRCWKPLNLAMWMNEHSDYWYRHIHGDKETFHMAWRKLGQSYAMPSRGIHSLAGTMCQHDFDGRRLFQHRNLRKWKVSGNERVHDFLFEDECLKILDQLRPVHRVLHGCPAFDGELAAELLGARVDYHRVGFDQRTLHLLDDGTIGQGADRMERFWGVRKEYALTVFELFGDDGVTARLVRQAGKPTRWRGQWLIYERMPIELTVIEQPIASSPESVRL